MDYRDGLDSRVKLLLCYRNVVRRSWQAPGPDAGYEFDHVIPSSEFAQLPAGSPNKRLENHIANIGVLPPSLNRVKSDKPLSDAGTSADKELISSLIDVPVTSFNAMSSANAIQQLIEFRSPRLVADLTDVRASQIATSVTG